jgi:hypothetical protein
LLSEFPAVSVTEIIQQLQINPLQLASAFRAISARYDRFWESPVVPGHDIWVQTCSNTICGVRKRILTQALDVLSRLRYERLDRMGGLRSCILCNLLHWGSGAYTCNMASDHVSQAFWSNQAAPCINFRHHASDELTRTQWHCLQCLSTREGRALGRCHNQLVPARIVCGGFYSHLCVGHFICGQRDVLYRVLTSETGWPVGGTPSPETDGAQETQEG